MTLSAFLASSCEQAGSGIVIENQQGKKVIEKTPSSIDVQKNSAGNQMTRLAIPLSFDAGPRDSFIEILNLSCTPLISIIGAPQFVSVSNTQGNLEITLAASPEVCTHIEIKLPNGETGQSPLTLRHQLGPTMVFQMIDFRTNASDQLSIADDPFANAPSRKSEAEKAADKINDNNTKPEGGIGGGNTGDGGTGGGNTGDGGTGGGNTGDGGTGGGNTGDGGTGGGNTGDGNTGDGSTGDGSTGDGSTGDGSTGGGNTGDGSTGGNTGDGSTGDGSTGGDNTGGGNDGDDANPGDSGDNDDSNGDDSPGDNDDGSSSDPTNLKIQPFMDTSCTQFDLDTMSCISTSPPEGGTTP